MLMHIFWLHLGCVWQVLGYCAQNVPSKISKDALAYFLGAFGILLSSSGLPCADHNVEYINIYSYIKKTFLHIFWVHLGYFSQVLGFRAHNITSQIYTQPEFRRIPLKTQFIFGTFWKGTSLREGKCRWWELTAAQRRFGEDFWWICPSGLHFESHFGIKLEPEISTILFFGIQALHHSPQDLGKLWQRLGWGGVGGVPPPHPVDVSRLPNPPPGPSPDLQRRARTKEGRHEGKT